MRSHLLYWPSLLVAALGAVVVAVGAIHEPARTMVAVPLAWVAAGFVVVLFVRALFDPRVRRGIDAANREILGPHGFQFRRTKLNDPRWGVFGTQTGSPVLLAVRAVLFIELLAAMPFVGLVGSELLHLAAASAGVAMMLSFIHAGLAMAAEGERA